MEFPITVHDVNGQPLSQLEVLANKTILETVEGRDIARKLIETFMIGPEIEEYRSALPTASRDLDQARVREDLMKKYSTSVDKEEGSIYYPTGMFYASEELWCHLPQMYGISAVNTALDELGITEIRTASPEDVMGLIRENVPLTKEFSKFPFAVLLYSPNFYNQWLLGEKTESAIQDIREYNGHGLGIFIRVAEHLHRQLKEFGAAPEDENIPVVIAGLRAYPDKSFFYGVRLDFTEKSKAIPAPAMPRDPYRLQERAYYKTKHNQTIEDALSNREEMNGDLFIGAPLMSSLPIHTLYFKREHPPYRQPPIDSNSIEIEPSWLPCATPVLLSRSLQ